MKFQEEALAEQVEYKRRKTPKSERVDTYILKMDFKNAFDSPCRLKFVKLLEKMHMNRTVIRAIKNLLTNTFMVYDHERIPSQKGFPQGSTGSPLYFKVYV